jgi:hypothetical protein
MSRRKKLMVLLSGLVFGVLALGTIVLLDSPPACATSEELEASYAAEWQLFEQATANDPRLAVITDDRPRLSAWCEANPTAAPDLCAHASAATNCGAACSSNDDCDWDIDSCDDCHTGSATRWCDRDGY